MTTATGKKNIGQGLFGLETRTPLSIIKAQEKTIGSKKLFIANMQKFDKVYKFSQNVDLMNLVYRMFETNPQHRISPQEILLHPFCQPYTQHMNISIDKSPSRKIWNISSNLWRK